MFSSLTSIKINQLLKCFMVADKFVCCQGTYEVKGLFLSFGIAAGYKGEDCSKGCWATSAGILTALIMNAMDTYFRPHVFFQPCEPKTEIRFWCLISVEN